MSLKLIVYTLGNLLICLAGTMLLPLGVAIYYQIRVGETESNLTAFVVSAILTLVVGLVLRFSIRAWQEELGIREGFAVVALGWVTVALFGSLPYIFADVFLHGWALLVDKVFLLYFESMAGFSTTGATVLTEIEHLSHAMLFWRSLSHWLGGMGNCCPCRSDSSNARHRWYAAFSCRGTRTANRSTHSPYCTNR